MSRVSARKIDKDIETGILDQFWQSLSKVKSPEDAYDFFSDLLTETEKMMLAKRLAIAILLSRGKKPKDIWESIKVSYTTIGTVGGWLKYARPKTKRLLTDISRSKDWGQIVDRVEGVLDKLPPRYGTDWSAAGRKKWRRKEKRSVRSRLR